MDPAGAQPGATRAEDVELDVVAHVQHLAGRAAALAGGKEDARVRLGRAVGQRAGLAGEQVGDADGFEVGVAVGHGHHRHPRRDPAQALERVGIEVHAVALAMEDRVRRFCQRDVAAGLAQRALDRQPPQRGQVMVQMRVLRMHLPAQVAHAGNGEALGGGRAVLEEEGVQALLDARADRREGPERVVEIEGDGADGKMHADIVVAAAGRCRSGRK